MEILIGIVIFTLLIIVIYVYSNLRKQNDEVVEELELSKSRISELEDELEASKSKIIDLEEELQKQKIENLRFTLNPHSFRNTLNTIEHLAKNTYESVHSLSGIFDYMLYDATNKYVPLDQEINFAREYLNLYRLRLKPTVMVKFEVDEHITNEVKNRMAIAPLISAHFIENAFKHGDLYADDAFIRIKLELLPDNHVVYSVRNLLSTKNVTKKGGLGSDAFENRLQLLYADNYQLDYLEKNNEYRANLKLKLYEI